MTADAFGTMLEPFAENGFQVLPGFLDAAVCRMLDAECEALVAAGGFHPAAIGRAGGRRHDSVVRSDLVSWLDGASHLPGQAAYFERMEALRAEVNRSLYLGLNGFEAHFAIYPPGAFYRRHLDRFRDDDARTLTAVLYLNPGWPADAGGQLQVELDGGSVSVEPEAGTLVLFLSDRFWHQVLPATRPRHSITGWFLRRNAALCW
ncbi:2OG-Fe(II) oxygenase [Paludibacterium yongneupense]|uniref:2OG-Fe(II) oxygenase n=1 Tax=Paludibacterium yongneupense TaxID=400061 RepID=UPI0004243642|nr:2OG-Fe(II) oxygenase [Paludibacterium yongneupense]